ncbi:hypothetical protein IQ266_19775 [filamentous cyanobacterium LEGE 11480]|uniref:Uncharacterized protein n=1 Tax=Romeriopsis navalis LEGE 11480 TaxID=2777977 RepID=A0A928VPA5_9CYAN|nr:hypothetical protein [Romeriopsis navalis]MBE9031980.1 hypothetical protein [Romeriopsis navalis LEGE 11480]
MNEPYNFDLKNVKSSLDFLNRMILSKSDKTPGGFRAFIEYMQSHPERLEEVFEPFFKRLSIYQNKRYGIPKAIDILVEIAGRTTYEIDGKEDVFKFTTSDVNKALGFHVPFSDLAKLGRGDEASRHVEELRSSKLGYAYESIGFLFSATFVRNRSQYPRQLPLGAFLDYVVFDAKDGENLIEEFYRDFSAHKNCDLYEIVNKIVEVAGKAQLSSSSAAPLDYLTQLNIFIDLGLMKYKKSDEEQQLKHFKATFGTFTVYITERKLPEKNDGGFAHFLRFVNINSRTSTYTWVHKRLASRIFGDFPKENYLCHGIGFFEILKNITYVARTITYTSEEGVSTFFNFSVQDVIYALYGKEYRIQLPPHEKPSYIYQSLDFLIWLIRLNAEVDHAPQGSLWSFFEYLRKPDNKATLFRFWMEFIDPMPNSIGGTIFNKYGYNRLVVMFDVMLPRLALEDEWSGETFQKEVVGLAKLLGGYPLKIFPYRGAKKENQAVGMVWS